VSGYESDNKEKGNGWLAEAEAHSGRLAEKKWRYRKRTIVVCEYFRFASRRDEPFYPIGQSEDKNDTISAEPFCNPILLEASPSSSGRPTSGYRDARHHAQTTQRDAKTAPYVAFLH